MLLRGVVRVLSLAGLVVGLSLAATPASGDQFVTFDLSGARVSFGPFDVGKSKAVSSSETHLVTINQSAGSSFDLKLEDGVSILEGTRINSGNAPPFDLHLTMTKQPDNTWTATGTLGFTDNNKATLAVAANVKSTDVQILPGNVFFMTASLANVKPNTAILVNRGDPWQYVGELPIAGAAVQSNVVSVPTPELFTTGALISIKFGVPGGTLDSLFANNTTIAGAEVKGEIVPVPAPAAVVLGMIGLSLVGWRMRRYA